jgi:hypothetical protein
MNEKENMSNELETLTEVQQVLVFLAENFDHTGNEYMYEVLSELAEKIGSSVDSILEYHAKSSMETLEESKSIIELALLKMRQENEQ